MKIRDLHKSSFTRHLVVGVVIFSVLFVALFLSNYGLLKRFELEVEEYGLKSEIQRLKQVHDSLSTRIEDAERDTFEIEKVAREKYGLVKPGEKIFFIEQDSNKITK